MTVNSKGRQVNGRLPAGDAARLPVRLLRRLVESELASNRLDPTTAIVGCATTSVAALQSATFTTSLTASVVEPRRHTTDATTETVLWGDAISDVLKNVVVLGEQIVNSRQLRHRLTERTVEQDTT